MDVQIDNLVYRYPDGDKDVLKDIQLDVPAGTSVAFVGGSGSGKTTLVDLILGLLTPTSGTISSQGKDIHTTCIPGTRRLVMSLRTPTWVTARCVRQLPSVSPQSTLMMTV